MRPEVLFPLFRPINTLKGIGPRLAALIEKLAGPHVVDVLFHLPSGAIMREEIETLTPQHLTRQIIIKTQVIKHHPSRSRRVPYKISCLSGDEKLTLTFFNGREDYLRRALPEREERIISGKLEQFSGSYQITHPDHISRINETADIKRCEPVYPLTAGVTSKTFHKALIQALEDLPHLSEWTDPHLIGRQNWPKWREALQASHNPNTISDLEPENLVRQRLAYDELLSNQVALELVRRSMRRRKGRRFEGKDGLITQIENALPYSLTHAQQSALSEIFADMHSDNRMLRLLQGDVGSGKTAVALMALAKCVQSGAQGAMMAPTEILARQHIESIKPFIDAAGLNVALLTGRLKGKKREALLEEIANGNIHIIVGTHALFQDDVIYHDLGLAIIDEQHRFGVHQRLSLSAKGRPDKGGVDILVMTATPIPRTLALTAYGDMDVSIIGEKPPGRKPVTTRAIDIARLDDLANSLSRKLADGERIYWVCPLVEESEVIDLAAAEDRYEYLNRLYPGHVGLVHGKMKADEKDAAMQNFKEGVTKILVATTVIEVGVDVPEATVMVIEHSERFGLAQLHQLRGRVGRGGLEGSCLLLYTGPLGETQKARIKIMRETEDGFRIAEEDLRLRGAGEFLGTRQSGMPVFKLADLAHHSKLLNVARDDARAFLEQDPELNSERGQAIRTLLYLFERDSAIRYLSSG
ncbi:ATP-dependent DNA helicase RecG [Sneathiella sp. P13V-1]|uniref:ATP-dependent DNA helicase RecG n=1 Tax=Sneathiella sp. P13V-1 TaxID=2697366 RepID=UPI00187B29AF|nr:ATP-dependent DNA helicase RecG [Sneathiella sp. P13V-1]MBE7637375.1 ATP-dependent DNA helicase RecG [Sneathiella sp. P13V-1]